MLHFYGFEKVRDKQLAAACCMQPRTPLWRAGAASQVVGGCDGAQCKLAARSGVVAASLGWSRGYTNGWDVHRTLHKVRNAHRTPP